MWRLSATTVDYAPNDVCIQNHFFAAGPTSQSEHSVHVDGGRMNDARPAQIEQLAVVNSY